MANLIEDGDEVVVGVNGAFGTRLAEVASRLGAKVHKVEAEWGTIVEPAQVAAALKAANETQAGRDSSCRDLDRDTSADRGNRRAGPSARRDDGDRRGDVARMRAGRDRRLGDRRLLQLHAEGHRRAAGTVAGDVQRARDGVGAQAQDEVPLVVLRRRADRAVLGARPPVPSHRADHDELRALRGAADRGRGRARSALAAPSHQRGRVPGRTAGDGICSWRRRRATGCRS